MTPQNYGDNILAAFDNNVKYAVACVHEILMAHTPDCVTHETIFGGNEYARIYFEEVRDYLKSKE